MNSPSLLALDCRDRLKNPSTKEMCRKAIPTPLCLATVNDILRKGCGEESNSVNAVSRYEIFKVDEEGLGLLREVAFRRYRGKTRLS